jgi:hypothetical protein
MMKKITTKREFGERYSQRTHNDINSTRTHRDVNELDFAITIVPYFYDEFREDLIIAGYRFKFRNETAD